MKNNIVRKALSLLLAGVMMASSASPAFAGEVSESEAGAAGAAQETEKTAQEVKEPITLAGIYSEETKEPEAQPQGEEKEDGGEREEADKTDDRKKEHFILLDSDPGASYSYDGSRADGELSTGEYTVLVYEAGENVSFSVKTELPYVIYTLENRLFMSSENITDGHISFTMPDTDLGLSFGTIEELGIMEEGETETELSQLPEEETHLESGVSEEIEENLTVLEEPKRQEAAAGEASEAAAPLEEFQNDEVDLSPEDLHSVLGGPLPYEMEEDTSMEEGASNENAETNGMVQNTEDIQPASDEERETDDAQEIPEETQSSDPAVDENLPEAETEIKDISTADNMQETETEAAMTADEAERESLRIIDGYPVAGSEHSSTQLIWNRDKSLDLHTWTAYEGVNAEALDHTDIDVSSMKDGDSFSIRYKVSLKADETYFWYETVKFIIAGDRSEATVISDEGLTLLPDWIPQEGSVLPLPEHTGDMIDGEEYNVYADDEGFDLQMLTNGYDITKFRLSVEIDGGFDIHTPGTYAVVYRVTYFLAPDYPWYVSSTVNVLEKKEGSTITVVSDTIRVLYNKETVIPYQAKFIPDSSEFTLTVKGLNTTILHEADPEVTASDEETVVTKEKTSENEWTFQVSLPEGGNTGITVSDQGNDVLFKNGKGYAGAWRSLEKTDGLSEEEIRELETYFGNEIYGDGSDGGMMDLDDSFLAAASESAEMDADASDKAVSSLSVSGGGTGVSANSTAHDINTGAVVINGVNVKIKDSAQKKIVKWVEDKFDPALSEDEMGDLKDWLDDVTIKASCKSSHDQAGWSSVNSYAWNLKCTAKYSESSEKWKISISATGNASQSGNYQKLAGSTSKKFDAESGADFYISKGSKRPDITNAYATFFSVAGAAFVIKDKDGNTVASVTIDEDGVSDAVELPSGTYTIEEVEPPRGYQIEEDLESFEIDTDDFIYYVDDAPDQRPVKIKKSSTIAFPADNPNYTLAGAKFTLTSKTIPDLVYSFTTDADGNTPEQVVKLGDYVLHEEVTPKNFYPAPDKTVTVSLTSGLIQTFEMKDEPMKMDLPLKKKSAEAIPSEYAQHYSLEGAKFSVTGACASSGSHTLTTNAQGEAQLNDLWIDTYTVKETAASMGFVVNPASFTYTDGAGTLEIPQTPQKLEINLQKLTQNQKAYPITPEFGFAGAEYTVYDKNTGREAGKIAVNNDGAGTLTNLWFGEYTMKETKIPSCNAYLKDEITHTVSATPQGGVVVDGRNQTGIGLAMNKAAVNSTERFHYGSIELTKKLTENWDNYTEEKKQQYYDSGILQGIKFTFIHESHGTGRPVGDPDEVIVAYTDRYGHLDSGNLVFGNWTIVEDEATAPAGFDAQTWNKKIYYDSEHLNLEYDAIDPVTVIRYDLKLVKTDADSANTVAMAGFKFQILDRNGNKVKLTQNGKNTPSYTFITDETGMATFTNLDQTMLPPGKYTLREIATPDNSGYQLSGTDVPFEISKDDNGKTVSVSMPNKTVMGLIKVTKIDTLTGEKCGPGFVFDIYAAEDIKDGSGTVREGFSRGEKVDTITTGNNIPEDDESTAVSKPLYLGKYTIKESKASDGYVINEKTYDTQITENTVSKTALPVEIHIPDGPSQMRVLKVDEDGEKALSGVVYRIARKEDTADYSSETPVSIGDSRKQHIFVTDREGYINVRYLAHNATYTVQEISPAPGYNKDETIYEFTTDDRGYVNGELLYTMKLTNRPNRLHVSKIDATNSKEVPGAHLVLTDENGRVMIAEEVTFTLEDSGQIQTVVMKDMPCREVEISKKDITNEEEVPGAKLTITDAEGIEIESWISEKTPHKTRLPEGKYVLTEEIAAKNYEIANSVRFEVKKVTETDYEVQHVVMYDSPYREVEISKTDITSSKELPGAHLKITDKEGKVWDSWISADKPHMIRLHSGEYTLTETLPAQGYTTAESITFTVLQTSKWDYEVQHVKMEDSPTVVHLSKTDITTGTELPGATLIIRDKNGATIEQWVSTDTPHIIERLPVGKYTLVEITAPEGYETSEEVEFTVTDTKEIQKVVMKDSPHRDIEISKTDITSGKEIPGARLQVIDSNGNTVKEWTSGNTPYTFKLPSGIYTLIERKPGDGFVTAEDIVFTVTRRGEGDYDIQHVKMEDDVTKVKISKKDITNKKELPGAKLKILDENGDVVEKWTSGKKPHYIEKLPIGNYTLVEVTAPNGYEKAEKVKFTVEDTGEIQKVHMYDEPVLQPETPSSPDVPKTGDTTPILGLLALMISSFSLILLSVFGTYRKRKKRRGTR